MAILKKKSFIVIIITLVSVITFSLLGVVSFKLNKLENRNQNNVVAADLTITTFNELSSFANSVYKYSVTSFQEVDNSYAGKTIELGANIDCGGQELSIGVTLIAGRYTASPAFNGTFDGKGFTISNFTISDSVTLLTSSSGGYESFKNVSGLFLELGSSAQVKNLRIFNAVSNNGVVGGYGGTTTTYSGAIVGKLSGGTITCCSVEGFEGDNGIIASGSGTITNCYTSDISSGMGIGPSEKTYSMGVGGDSFTNTTSISNCIVTDTNISALTTTYCYNQANKITGLTYSSAGGNYNAAASDGAESIWYYASDYDNGWPYLRLFMNDWKTINFSSEDTAKGTVDKSSIKIPSDAFANFSAYDSKLNKSSTSLNIYDQIITARAGIGYSFNKWVSSISATSVSYTAYFTEDFYYYEFEDLIIDGVTIEPTCSTFENGTQKIKIGLGTDAEVECEHTQTATIIRYEIGDHVVTYTITLVKYTMDESGKIITNMQVDSDYSEDLEVAIENFNTYHNTYYWSSRYTFEVTAPTLKLKTYNANFQ